MFRAQGTSSKTMLIVGLVLLAVVAVAGCGGEVVEEPDDPTGDDPTEDPIDDDRYGGRAAFRTSGEPPTLNPYYGTDSVHGQIMTFMAERLVRVNDEGEYEGQLAKDWEISDDGLVYTFNLVEDARWHDGEPFTADDVIFSFELMLDESLGASNRGSFLIGGEPIEMEKVDEHTVEMILPEVFGPVLTSVGRLPVAPKHLLEDADPANFQEHPWGMTEPVHTGPFKFVEYESGEYVRLERFDDYWGENAYLDEAIFRIIPDTDATRVALETGQIHFSDLPSADYDRIVEDGELQTFAEPSGLVQFVALNNVVFPFDDVQVRRAINHLVDRETIIDHALMGYGEPAYNFMVPGDMFYNEDVLDRKYYYDVDEAVSLLKDAGYERGDDDIMVRDGERLEFEVIIAQGNRERERAATIMQADFEKAGVDMQIRTMEWSAQVDILTSTDDPLDYQAQIVGNLLGPDPDRYHAVYGPSQYPEGSNYIAYLNEEVEDLFMQARREVDPDERAALYEELQRVIVNDAPVLWLWYTESLYAYSPELRVEDARMNGLVHVRFMDPANIWLDE